MSASVNELAFSMIKGLGLAQAIELETRVGGAEGFFATDTRTLWNQIGAQKDFCTDAYRQSLLKTAQKEAQFIKDSKAHAYFHTAGEYPGRLRMCDDAPSLIFGLGRANLNAKHVIAIVGTRRCSAYGIRMVDKLVEDLSAAVDSLLIVSGLAYGIDIAAHKAALEHNVPTVGVVAHGLKTLYPAEHRDIAARMIKNGGGIITEYISTAPVHRGNFLARNRIVAGMSDVTILVESDTHGGAMVTASLADAYNRTVAAFPGRANDVSSAGPNMLIRKKRAELITSAADLLEIMNWSAQKASPPPPPSLFNAVDLNPDGRKIIDHLRLHPNATANDMVTALNIPYSLLSSQLTDLEMRDVLTALPGGRFLIN